MKHKKGISKIKNHPIVIYIYRFLYHSYFRYFISLKFKSSYLTNGLTLQPSSNGISFFGYYDKSPVNSKGDLIFLQTNSESERHSIKESANLYLKRDNGSCILIGKTRSYNWQQGCMLNWLDDEHIILNDFDERNDYYYSKVIDLAGNQIKRFEIPIYTVHSPSRYALGINFDRLTLGRPDYGYFNKKNLKLPSTSEDGIWLLNLDTGVYNLTVILKTVIDFKQGDYGNNPNHRINHLEFSPDGKKLVFLHRWNCKTKRYSRFFVCDRDGNNLKLLLDENVISHYCWLNNYELLIYCSLDGYLGFYRLNINSKKASIFSKNFIKEDGHPSLSSDGKYIIVDTYPPKDRFSKLFLYKLEEDQIIKIGEFFQPVRYSKEFRIDLHPKWDTKGNRIFFESGHDGKRKLYSLKLFE